MTPWQGTAPAMADLWQPLACQQPTDRHWDTSHKGFHSHRTPGAVVGWGGGGGGGGSVGHAHIHTQFKGVFDKTS